jgi:hypothetical protein
MTNEEIIAQLKAENEALKAKAQKRNRITLKVSEKFAVSAYGMGRFPVTLYREQWERLLDAADDIRAFIADNADVLTLKGDNPSGGTRVDMATGEKVAA